jgi:hypothetical protein
VDLRNSPERDRIQHGEPESMLLVVLIQIVFQVLTGSRRIKLPFVFHRINGYLILVLGLIHGIMAISMYF